LPEILGVTNPSPAHDSALNNRNLPVSPGSVPIQNVPDPSRVTKLDGRTEQQNAGAQSSTTRFDSNFQTFVQRLGGMSELATAMGRVLSGRTGMLVSSGMGEGIAEELSQFMDMLRMDRGQFLRFLTSQMQSGTRFGGALFALLRGAYEKSDSDGLRGDILQFLKRYSDNSSTSHIEGNLLRNLNQMARAIPARWGNQLIEMLGRLENGASAGDRAGNLKLLQGEVLPFMSEYVARTHDLGRARDLLSLLVLDVSRYESGSEANMLQAFHLVKNHPALRDTLRALDDQALLVLLKNSAFTRAGQENAFANRLTQLSEQTLRGSGGVEAQNAFRELISAFLVNESVYMSLNHLVIPLEWAGKLMFSELWVDPDAEPDTQRDKAGKTQRFLFKIDIESLGFFDVVLNTRGTAVDLQVQCPEKLAPFLGVIESNMTRILVENGLQAKSVRVKKMERPFTISEVFPKLFEGKDSVNVKI